MSVLTVRAWSIVAPFPFYVLKLRAADGCFIGERPLRRWRRPKIRWAAIKCSRRQNPHPKNRVPPESPFFLLHFPCKSGTPEGWSWDEYCRLLLSVLCRKRSICVRSPVSHFP